ncbi:MAG: class II fumarate hydratase [Pseudomonadota bacterium]
MTQETRVVSDSMGELEVPADALYGAQTQRAINNFPISGQGMPRGFIEALLLVKETAARTNEALECLDGDVAQAIIAACEETAAREDLLAQFPVDVFQTGSGTSSNMNANEVIGTLASARAGQEVNPNDHVNFGQSSNDVIPTTIHVSAALAVQQQLLPALEHLADAIDAKSQEVGQHVKTGRTHLMDAMPVTFAQILGGWASQIKQCTARIVQAQDGMLGLTQGGTAVGTGINTHPEFAVNFAANLAQKTGLNFRCADNFFAAMGSQDAAVALSGQLKTTAVALTKIANDLRWMNSGPLAGLGDITLEALQPGSSIMPGKVNPVIPEATCMVAAQVIGNDTTITVAGQAGNFELNVMLPVIASNLLQSIELLANVSTQLADRAIATFAVNVDNLARSLDRNPILVTALNTIIGYNKAAAIAKQAYAEQRPIIEVALEATDLTEERLRELLDPAKLTEGGLT